MPVCGVTDQDIEIYIKVLFSDVLNQCLVNFLKSYYSQERQQTRLKKEHYLMRREHNVQIFDKLSFSNIGQDKSKLQKQISKLLILIAMVTFLDFH